MKFVHRKRVKDTDLLQMQMELFFHGKREYNSPDAYNSQPEKEKIVICFTLYLHRCYLP